MQTQQHHIVIINETFGLLVNYFQKSLNTFQKGSDDIEICRVGSSYNLFLIDCGIKYIVYFMDNGHEYILLCCLLIVHILAS